MLYKRRWLRKGTVLPLRSLFTMPVYQFRKIVFTQHVLENVPVLGKCQYLAYALETCPTTGKKHFQGFAYSKSPWSFKKWTEAFPGAHIEYMRGNFASNERYCSKEGQLIEAGQKPMEDGKRRTLIAIKEDIEAGIAPIEAAEEPEKFPTWCQNYRALELYKHHIRKKSKIHDREQPKVYVRLGPAGTGKTQWADEQFGKDGWVFAPDNTGQWFDNCDRDVIVFDDVERGQIPPLSLWKRLTDRYGFSVPYKGGFLYWKPKVIIFTSNSHPKEWWPDLSPFDIDAIERRITEIIVVE